MVRQNSVDLLCTSVTLREMSRVQLRWTICLSRFFMNQARCDSAGLTVDSVPTALYILYFNTWLCTSWGTRWRIWLRHRAASRKVAGSIPDGVIGIFHWHNPSGCAMAPGLTQPLTEMSATNISWGKGGRCIGLTTLPPSCPDCLEIWEPQRPGTLRACPGL